ncbi:MAG: hypothetical protein AAF688_08460 [Bacteroidota bacterium]
MLSIGNGLIWPSFLSILSSTGSKRMQGAIQGYGTSTGSIASMLGLISGGILFESLTTDVFLLGGITFFVITVLMLVHYFRHRKSVVVAKSGVTETI